MINELHALLHRPEKGWDPVSVDYARGYADYVWAQTELIEREVRALEARVGSLQGVRLLDLGGGPGQYACAFARRGAEVTWHDVSSNYRNLVAAYARNAGVTIRFSLGYLEEAGRAFDTPFDVVFSRVCWFYCRNDAAFARQVFDLVREGGTGHIIFLTPDFEKNPTIERRVRYWLYERTNLKIGHLHPRAERLAGLFAALGPTRLDLDQSDRTTAVLTFVK